MKLIIDLDDQTYYEVMRNMDCSNTNIYDAIRNGVKAGKTKNETEIIQKVVSIFNNSNYIQNFKIVIKGGVEEPAYIEHTIKEFF